MALEASQIIERTINIKYCITFEYKDMNKVMRIIKENKLNITKQELELNCKVYISVRKKVADKIKEVFSPLYEIKIDRLES